jgi:hypothetical protein
MLRVKLPPQGPRRHGALAWAIAWLFPVSPSRRRKPVRMGTEAPIYLAPF